MDTFRVMNERDGWTVRLWTDADVPALLEQSNGDRAIIEGTQSLGAKSDLLRYEILYRYGGVYVDVDYECLQPVSSFLSRCYMVGVSRCQLFCGVSNTVLGKREANNGFIGCVAGHPLLLEVSRKASLNIERAQTRKRAIQVSIQQWLSQDDISALSNAVGKALSPQEVIACSGPEHWSRCLDEYLNQSAATVVVFPSQVLHPVPNYIQVSIEDESALELAKAMFVG
jgi:mannosyltransferase OCH1-like enzyme